jgi:integrase
MASVRKKEGRPRKDGTLPIYWVVSWVDLDGKQRTRNCKTQKEAKALAAEKTLTPGQNHETQVRDVANAFLAHFLQLWHSKERSRSTYEQKRQHLEIHLLADPIARERISELDAPKLQRFFDRLIEQGVSYALARKIAATVKQMIQWGALRGTPARDGALAAHVTAPRSKRLAKPAEIPPRDKCKSILDAADQRAVQDRGRARAAVRVLMLNGLRPGELRALDWADFILAGAHPRVTIRRSADKWNTIAALPKTDTSVRTLALSPDTVMALKAWKLACPPTHPDTAARLKAAGGSGALAFPNAMGKVWPNEAITRNMWTPLLRAVGLASGQPSKTRKHHPNGDYREMIWTPHYSLKQARHVAASVAIANGAQPKKVQSMMGHSTIKLTMDLYSHLWPDDEEDARMAAAADRAFD